MTGSEGPARILFLVSSMQGGGAERVASLLCNDWAGLGHKVILLPTFSGRGVCLYSLDERVKLEYLADYVGAGRFRLLNGLRRLLALRRFVQRHEPDVVVSFLTRVNVAALLATVGLPVRRVVSERNHPIRTPIGCVTRLARCWLYRLADAIIVQTHENARWFERRFGAVPIFTIPNPVIADAGARGECTPDILHGRQVVLGAGRLTAQKGFDRLIRAFGQLAGRFPEWDLVIIGEGGLRPSLESQRDAEGLVERVHLPGRVDDPSSWYRRADLYVLSSHFEGFPNTLLEAMAHGLAAVSFDCETGPRDIIRDGVTGLLVPPEKGVNGLVGAMERMMSDETYRLSAGKQALEVLDRFSMTSVRRLWLTALGVQPAAVA